MLVVGRAFGPNYKQKCSAKREGSSPLVILPFPQTRFTNVSASAQRYLARDCVRERLCSAAPREDPAFVLRISPVSVRAVCQMPHACFLGLIPASNTARTSTVTVMGSVVNIDTFVYQVRYDTTNRIAAVFQKITLVRSYHRARALRPSRSVTDTGIKRKHESNQWYQMVTVENF